MVVINIDTVLSFINTMLTDAGINYHFMEYKTKKVVYPYHVGSLLSTEPYTEDGHRDYTIVIESFNRGSMSKLLEDIQKIENTFPSVGGTQTIINNQFIAVYFATSQPIETDVEGLQRIETNLRVKTWKGCE